MNITEKYVDFIVDNFIQDKIRVELPRIEEDGKVFWVKLGLVTHQDVDTEVLEKYTRSVKLKLSFDEYEVEKLLFIPLNSSPESVKSKFYEMVQKTVLESLGSEKINKKYEEKKLKFKLWKN
jgi:hypothetical protein